MVDMKVGDPMNKMETILYGQICGCVCGGCDFWKSWVFPKIFDVGNGYGYTLG